MRHFLHEEYISCREYAVRFHRQLFLLATVIANAERTLVQTTNIENKRNLKSLYTLILIFLCSNLAQAQPGWQDFTKRYSYNILDKNGKEISFKNNKDYSVKIDSILYKTPNIPQDSLKPALVNSYNGFENQIRINDFSLAIPLRNAYDEHKQLEIKIIHKKDTMYITQSSGTGSFWSIDFQGKPIKPTPDYTLQFIAGHYYFPSWAKNLLDNIPQTSGNTKIANVSQQHFIISKTVYDSVNYINPRYGNRQKHYDDAENLVVKNFMKGYFSFKRQVQPTTFDRSVSPFNKPRWSTWGGSYFPTKDKMSIWEMFSFLMIL